MGSFSHLLYRVGDTLHFAPDSTFAPARTEQDTAERLKPFLAYRLRIKTALARMCEQSFFLGLVSGFYRSFFNMRVRSFGVLFFSCGFLQILSYFLGVYLPFAAGDESNLIYGVTMIFLTLLCSFTRGDVKDVLKKSFLYRGILSPLFGSDGWQFPAGRTGDHFLVMILLGAALAFFSVVFSPFAVLFVILLLALMLFIFYQPEVGLVTVALTFFYVPFQVTAFFTFLTLVAFLFKCAIGKRTLVFSLSDGIVMLCLIPFLFSAKSRLLVLVLGSLYLLAMGLLRTLASVRRLLCALMLGGVFCSLMILARYAVTALLPELLFRFPKLDSLLFLGTDENTMVLLAMVCPLSSGWFRSLKTRAKLFLSPLVFILFLGAIFCGASASVWIALLVALVVQSLMTNRFALVVYSGLSMALIAVVNLIPYEYLQTFLEYFGFSASARADGSLLPALSVKNLYSFCLLAGLICFFVWAVVAFASKATRPEAFPRVLGAVAGMAAFVVAWLSGVSADERILVLFVMLLALPRVSLICAKREEIRLPY